MGRLDMLRKQDLFRNLNEDELGKIAVLVEDIMLLTDDPVFEEGEDTAGIYMVRSGKVEITKSLPLDRRAKLMVAVRNIQNCCEIQKTSGGWKQVFGRPEAGQFFGELSIIEGRKVHGADAHAAEATELYLLRAEHYRELEEKEPVISSKILKSIASAASQRIRDLDRQLCRVLTGY